MALLSMNLLASLTHGDINSSQGVGMGAYNNTVSDEAANISIDSNHAVAFFDIDGTLVWRDFEALANGGSAEGVMGSFGAAPTPAVYEAFNRMASRGHASFICTGRPLCMIYPSLRELNATGIVACAGAYAAIGSTVVRDEHIEPQLIAQVLQLFSAVGANVLMESNECSIELCPPGFDPCFPGSQATESLEKIEEIAKVSPFAKFCAMGLSPDVMDRLRPQLEPHFTICDLQGGIYEFSLHGVDKGSAITAVLDYLGRNGNLANTYAFGDSENDLSMASAVQTFVAMGNALPNVQAAADYITDSAADDGVVTGLEHFGVI